MKMYKCPICGRNGISFYGRYFSHKRKPVICKCCDGHVYLKPNGIIFFIQGMIDYCASFIILILCIAFDTLFFFFLYLLFAMIIHMILNLFMPLVSAEACKSRDRN